MTAMRITRMGVAVSLAVMALAPSSAQTPAASLHRPFDEILEPNVRDGFVYYLALRQTRAALDRYVAALDVAPAVYDAWSRDDQLAFWVNAHNAFVLQTVIDRYPIRGRSKDYPPNSVRQIPGAFDKRQFRAAGRHVTLDEIDKTILPEFKDPRVFFALGMGAVASGRLRSEAYTGARLQEQLGEATREFLTTTSQVEVDRTQTEIAISAIIGWHEKDFVAALGNADPRFAARSPIEQAVVALITPYLYPLERQLIDRNEFRVRYKTFDWALNDLTGGRR